MATQPTSSALVRFADFKLDLRTGDLHRDGASLKLQPQPARVLVMLVSRAGEIVTRQELAKEVWGSETFVDFEQGLNFAIRQIRAVLEDDADRPRFVETLPKRGYRFIGQTRNVPSELPMPVTLPEGVQETVRPFTQQAKQRWQPASRVTIVTAATILVVGGVLLFGLRSRVFHAKAPSLSPYATAIRSIAVLPLDNLSKDSGQDYFSDGITDALTTELAQIGSLRVISRTSAMHFKGSRETLTEIGRRLNVEGIVEGSITRSENRVRITAQLIDAHTDRHLWAKTYEKDLKDVLDLQDEVARDIAAEIRIRLTPQEQSRLTASRETNPQAYDAYLRGRYLWGQRNAEATTKAVGYFQQAVQEEPDFAPAYSGLSDCYSVGWGAKADDLRLAEAYARKALSLQPDLAEGHTSLAMADVMQHKMADADDELRRALELNPNYAMAHHFYAGYLLALGRPADALAENDRARQLDPLSIPINMMRAMILTGLREYDQVLDQLERTTEIAPQSPVLNNLLARIYWLEGRVPEAIVEERKAGTLAHSSERLHDLKEVAAAYATSGLRAARVKSAQLMERHQNGNYEAIFVALQYGNLENEAKVLHWLEQSSSANERNFLLLTKTAPEFDFLRANLRFQNLLRRAGVQP